MTLTFQFALKEMFEEKFRVVETRPEVSRQKKQVTVLSL